MSDLTLSPDEIAAITGYRSSTRQLNQLHARGFVRAYIGPRGVVLERAHYEAVCRGEYDKRPERKAANLDFLRVGRSVA
ncbi:DUF4224 domain-containing protein [Ottowia testudinis]|uniref:DUF4224 domain-containing protein n=1 Tax=Ottowia testudinis TaxID=2816950 RepID=A0A975H2A3_9BURK|nr:DUF4224 domain-containing protein [Ottowia testudinis]QTD44584.1 DUF4224 domain-containing protein [Ottowia testudinis]